MRLAFVMGKLRGGGAERVTASLINELSKDGHDVHLISYESDEKVDYPISKETIVHTMEPVSSGRLGLIFAKIKYFRRTMKDLKPDCVICLDGAKVKTVLTIASLRRTCPLILAERNNPAQEPKGTVLRFLRLMCYFVCDGVVFQTAGARDFFPKSIRKKSAVIQNPLSQHLPEPYRGPRSRRIVNFCRLIPQKNLPLLMDAFSDLAAEFPDYRLEIFGEGPLHDSLQEHIAALGLENCIFLREFINPIYSHIQDAALFVSSSNYEGISNSMLEAMAMGIPSVCTDCPPGGARETIQDGVNGLLVPVGDRKAMGQAIRRILSDSDLAGQITGESIKIRNRLAPDKISEQWLMYAEQIAARYRKGH